MLSEFKKPFFVLVGIVCFKCSSAQQTILLNQSAYNPFALNPAAIGLNADATAHCHYKKNWLGITESPEILQLTIDGATSKNKAGLGLNIINEKAGIFSKTYLSGAFRYRINLNKESALFFGISAGFQRLNSDFSKMKADAPAEFSQWPSQQAVTIPDAAFGLVYSFKKLLVSLAAKQLLQQNYIYKEPVFNKELQYKSVSQFILALQNTFILKPATWFYIPQLILRTPQGLPVQFDFVNTLDYKNKFLFALGYRNYYAAYATLGFSINEKLRIMYSYEYSLGIQNHTKGGHELGITFNLSNRPSKTKTETLSQSKLDEILERLDKHDQQIETVSKKTDSLDKKLAALKSEIDLLKNQQVSEEDLNKAIETYLSKKESPEDATGKKSAAKYKVIRAKTGNDFESFKESENANYKIVLGVYQNSGYSKDFQKFIKRELDLDTKLVQLPGHPKNYIYVCTVVEYTKLSDGLNALKSVRKTIKSKTIEITKGEAWILQTLN
ncbi:hypothetical protein CNR22_11200 [Sphingobacteriaceae bacterium]|nr:hypothetical protein CNR22_11200 [Sphingobacteriaceae bacterium]